jgi:hypothetical protein
MSKRVQDFDDAALDRALIEMATRIDWPPEPDLAPGVRAALEAVPSPRPRRAWTMPRRAFAFGTALVVVIATLTLAFSPATRQAVADWLGIGGVRISFGRGPTPTASPGTNLALGTRKTLDAARDEVDFPVSVPSLGGLGPPDFVYVSPIPPGGRVSLVYRAEDGLPNTDETGLGMIVTEFRASLEPDFAKKIIGDQGRLEVTEVDGDIAYWIEGPHTIYIYKDREGLIREDTVRLAGNALLWERDGITYRIESALSLERARAIAESMT